MEEKDKMREKTKSSFCFAVMIPCNNGQKSNFNTIFEEKIDIWDWQTDRQTDTFATFFLSRIFLVACQLASEIGLISGEWTLP